MGGCGGITMEQHTHAHTKAVLNRMSRAIGHMNAVKKMIEEGRDCSDVLIQLSAIKSEITGVSKVILKDHIDHCIVDAVKENDEDAIEHLKGAIDKLL
ncbi:MAG: metal-sensing transcriptional repressor [Clostridia bacterium]|nr:metal-sensing transcriptional repressor [Clostridia bacterium]